MSKIKIIYACTSCGSQASKWAGQCSDCGAWNTLVEETIAASIPSKNKRTQTVLQAEVTILSDIDLQTEERLSSQCEELDRVLGGGLVQGSVILLGGNPGIGKSTLLLQLVSQLAALKPLYISGEESASQISMRAKRLELTVSHLKMLADTRLENILNALEKEKPKLVIIDSIQTMFSDLFSSAPGSVSQVRECAGQLVQFAKRTGTTLFLVGHVTKEGALAGPRVLEHMVDTVLYFESDPGSRYRVVRAVKNRFGAVNELGVFAMTDKGLKEVNNPSAIFLSQHENPVAGSSVMVTFEGSRPMMIEVQTLVNETHLSNPRRISVGLDYNRLSMLLAVLHRHGGIATYNQDVFVNVVGGVKVLETAIDLPIILSVISSLKNRPLSSDLVIFGEVGLAGEIRPVQNGQERLRELVKHGFKRAIIPYANAPKKNIEGLEIIPVKTLQQAIKRIED